MDKQKIIETSDIVRRELLSKISGSLQKEIDAHIKSLKEEEGFDDASAVSSAFSSFILQTCVSFTVDYVNEMLSNLFTVEE